MAELNANFSLEQRQIRANFSLEQTTIPAIFKINAAGTTWGSISGNIQNQEDLYLILQDKASVESVETLAETVQNNYDTLDTKIDNTESALAGQITTLTNTVNINNQNINNRVDTVEETVSNLTDTVSDNYIELDAKISDNANDILVIDDTISGYGNIVTHNVNEFATAAQGALADSALQSGDNISELNNDVGYITSASLPTVNNASLTIQRNGSEVVVFTANDSVNKTANIVVPTQASDISALPDTTTIADLTTEAQLNAINSGATITNIGQITTNENAIADIRDLIPNQATSSNQLADKDFVNSSIATNTAYFIGTFNSVAELEAYSGPLTNNDYAFVATTDTAGNTLYDRYKYNADTQEWMFEYELNNSSFTAAQWASINSGITSGDVSLIQSALQPNDNISELVNDAGYITSASLPTVNNGTLDIQVNGTSIGTFTANQANNTTANIVVPDSATWGNITGTLSNQTDLQNALNTKQNVLTAGDNITIENNVISAKDTVYTAGTDIEIVKGSGGILPSGFQQLEYLESTGTQYIDTGVARLLTNSYRIETGITYSDTTTRQLNGVGGYTYFGVVDGFYQISRQGTGHQQIVATPNTFSDFDIDFDCPNNKMRYSINGGTKTEENVVYLNNPENGNFWLFALGTSGSYKCTQKLYYFNLYQNNVLVCDMIPARRISDGEVGMYDVIRRQFFTNAGTGSFIAGAPVGLPDGYKQVEYIESTGTQYIDTGYAPTSNTNSMKAQMKHSYLSYKTAQNKNPFVFGSSTLVGNLRCYNRTGLVNNNFVYTVTRDSSQEVDTDVSPVLGTVYDTEYSVNFGASASLKILNGSTVVVNDTQTGNMQRSTETYYLFAINHNVTVDGIRETICRVYSCKIWNNGTLVRDFVPCLDTNNVACMYDMVGKQTYYNAGTGTFEAGEVIGDILTINFTNDSGYALSSDLATVATTGDYDDLINKPTIPDISNLANKDLSNLSATGEAKFQAPLVSGTNIKTINGQSILGSGDLETPYRNIGEIVSSAIPLTDAGLHLLDGALINGSGIYSAFVDYIADLYDGGNYPNLFETEANWQTSVNTYGVCGKFVYDSTNNTVRLPKVTGIIEGTTDVSALGDLVEAGLPNITGHFVGAGIQNGEAVIEQVGALYQYNYPNNYDAGTGGNSAKGLGFDASRSSSIYGNSSTVQPQTIKYYYYIVIATSTKTDIQVDIDEVVTDLNGKADIDLSNCTKPHIVETYRNGTSWYRVYSDGWCEQGGIAVTGTYNVSLLKPFVNTNYNIVANHASDDTTLHTIVNNKTVTGFTIQSGQYNDRRSSLIVNADWRACGYIN